MADRYQSEETVGYGSRVKQSFGGALVGLVMFVVAFPLLFWNEGRAVAEHKALREGAGAVVAVQASPLDAANDGKLVHVVGTASASQTLVDPTFGLRADGIALKRDVEMFQWIEKKDTRTEKQLGGGEKRVTTYEYDKKWSDDRVDSDRFEHRDGHRNPDKFPFESNRVRADPVRLGDFVLSAGYVDDIGNAQPLVPALDQLPPNLAASFQLADGRLVT
ncbi:MAG TPA: TMEM43 family protein, partial [Tahibacter sp.]|nr:TMEM43 family protein [Tahibacter sp.]